jgi:hypothetical protein
MNTRQSPKKTGKAEDLSLGSFRWTPETHQSLLSLLLSEPQLFKVKNISNKIKHTKILERLDPVVFTRKAQMKWEQVENGISGLIKKYRAQAARFQKTGEGPTAKERTNGARNLEGIYNIDKFI